MTFLNLSLGSPVVRAADTVTGELGVVGARSSWRAVHRRGASNLWST